jgi:hypothetical protein
VNINRGDFVRVFMFNGVVKEIFRSDGGQIAIQVLFAKDVVRSKPAELHLVDDVQLSSLEEFEDEAKKIRQAQDEVLDSVRNGVC